MRQKGVSLVESLLIVVIISTIVFLMANLPNAMGLITKSKHLSLAREIATKAIEDKRATSYINLVNGTNAISDLRLNLLPSSSGQVEVSDCDPGICTNSEHIKKIKVIVNWKNNNKDQTVVLETFIGEGGLNQ